MGKKLNLYVHPYPFNAVAGLNCTCCCRCKLYFSVVYSIFYFVIHPIKILIGWKEADVITFISFCRWSCKPLSITSDFILSGNRNKRIQRNYSNESPSKVQRKHRLMSRRHRRVSKGAAWVGGRQCGISGGWTDF